MTTSHPSHHFSLDKPLLLAATLLGVVLLATGMLAARGAQSGIDAPIVPAGELQLLGFVELAPLAIGILMIVVVISLGWPTLVEVPNVLISRLGVLSAGVASVVAGAFGQPIHLAYIAALMIPATFLSEMLRRDGRSQLLLQISGTYSGSIVVLASAMWLFVARAHGGPDIALVGIAVILGGVCAHYVTPSRMRGLGSLIGTAVTGIVATLALGATWWATAAFIVAFALLGWALDKVARVTPQVVYEWSGATFVLINHCALGVVGYVLVLLVL